MTLQLTGYPRADGRKGIRNIVAVAYLVECAHFVAGKIVSDFASSHDLTASPVHLIGFPGCYPNEYAERMMKQLLTHPNVGAVLLISLGCESFDKFSLAEHVRASGRPVETLVIQQSGGTRSTVEIGIQWVKAAQANIAKQKRVPMHPSELIIGTVCGGSDGTSGITANPAVGLAFDTLIEQGAVCIFEETGELIGCERHMAGRAATPELGQAIVACVDKAARYYATLGHGSFAVGNSDGGLTTQEEKSLGAYCKSGNSIINGIIRPGELPQRTMAGRRGALYLLDVVPDGEVRFGFPNISDNAELVELMSCGAHLNLFTTGRGSVVGSALAPVIKVCANPGTYRRLADDMDINAGRVLESGTPLADVSDEIVRAVYSVAQGALTKSEALGHREFILGYKYFDTTVGPDCFPT